jgi:hypothetical protein
VIEIGNIEDKSLKDIINEKFDQPIATKLIDTLKLCLTDSQERNALRKRLTKAVFKDVPDEELSSIPNQPTMIIIYAFVSG